MAMMGRMVRLGVLTLLAGLTSAGCEPLDNGGAAAQSVATADVAAPPSDSVLTIEEEVRRFREEVGTSVDALSGGARSREELVRLFIAALEAGDAPSLGPLLMTPAEFIDLYYPHTRFTSRPYELSPQLVWFQLENYGSRGVFRALNRYGGKELRYRGHSCETLVDEGPNRIHSACAVQVASPETGDRETVSLFGQIIERDGRFKFISYGNRL